ncbi:MAG: SAM-dependent methyltransferase, partial [Acidimicrobiales bacterium]|nr:SAM-dependent methyltransferase [Acidimicrobiales bacterium]
WDDERAAALLRTTAAALPAEGRIVVVETVASNQPRDEFAATSDLMMLALASGRERTMEHYEDLFAAAGLVITRSRLLPTGATAFELVPS